jgi:death-on-curing protein
MITTDIIKEFNKIITSDGLVLSEHLLESSLSSYHYYDTIEEQITSVYRGLIKNHAFKDGNKRTAYMTLLFLCFKMNIELPITEKEAISITLKVAKSNLDVSTIAKLLFDTELSEAVTFTSYKTTRPIKPEQLSEFKRKMGNMKYAGTYSVIQTNAKTIIRVANDVLKDSRVKQMINSFGVSIDTSLNSTKVV